MAPCWPQLLEFLDQKPISGALDWPWWRDSFCEMFFGAPWSATTDSPLLALTGSTKMSLALATPALIGALLMTPAGALLLLMEKRKRWLLLFALLGPALMLVHMAHSGIRPYSWYLLPYLPGLILIWSAAFPFEENELEQVIIGAIVGVFVLLGGWNARSIYRHHPIEPSRDSVALYRTVTNPRNADIDKDVISGGFIMYTEGYDPALHRFKDAAGLRALMENADRTQRKLFINVGHIEYAREFGYAEVCRIIEDPAQFEHVGHLPGLLFSTTRDVFRYRGKN